MLAPDQLAAFLLAAIVVTVSPGPDNLMVLAMGMVNATVEHIEGLPIGLTYVTGALSRSRRSATPDSTARSALIDFRRPSHAILGSENKSDLPSARTTPACDDTAV